jgi:hypothetical protein
VLTVIESIRTGTHRHTHRKIHSSPSLLPVHDYLKSWDKLKDFVGKTVVVILGVGGHNDPMLEGKLSKVTH